MPKMLRPVPEVAFSWESPSPRKKSQSRGFEIPPVHFLTVSFRCTSTTCTICPSRSGSLRAGSSRSSCRFTKNSPQIFPVSSQLPSTRWTGTALRKYRLHRQPSNSGYPTGWLKFTLSITATFTTSATRSGLLILGQPFQGVLPSNFPGPFGFDLRFS